MADIKARVNPQKSITVSGLRIGASTRVSDLFDVDVTNISDGALLIYNSNTELWTATTKIENPNTQVNGGHY